MIKLQSNSHSYCIYQEEFIVTTACFHKGQMPFQVHSTASKL